MASMDYVARIALGLPEAVEQQRHGRRAWAVAGKVFAWERPFSKADLRRFGDVAPPSGPIVGIAVSSLEEKDVQLMAHPGSFFTIPHFDGYKASLIQLDLVTVRELRDALTDAWLACAPPALATALDRRASTPGRPSGRSPRRGSARPSQRARSGRGARRPSPRPRRRA